jgi:hypothetical protein
MTKPIKRLTYRDITGSSAQAHAAHWEGFTFQGGPWVCCFRGPWGQVQVWASSPEEGRRVCLHALMGGGWSERIWEGEFTSNLAAPGRNGRTRQMKVLTGFDKVAVSKRNGPSGPPIYADET